MKHLLLIVTIATIMAIGCKKSVENTKTQDDVVQRAKALLQSQMDAEQSVSANQHRSFNPFEGFAQWPDWNHGRIILDGINKVLIVPIEKRKTTLIQTNFSGSSIYELSEQTRFIFWNDNAGHLQGVQICWIPDSGNSKSSSFRGLVQINSINGKGLRSLRLAGNGQILVSDSIPESLINTQVRTNQLRSELAIIQTCYVVTGYNYSADNPLETYPWVQPLGCSYSFLDYSSAGANMPSISIVSSSVGSGGGSSAPTVIVKEGPNPIGNIKDYTKCFTNFVGPGHTYQVTICVDQPVSGSRSPWGLSSSASSSSAGASPVNVGHTFLIFTEISGTSSVIKRNVGFYPKLAVNPVRPSSPGSLNNDDIHGYDIALTYNVTSEQFFNMLNYAAEHSNDVYNLNSLNCTTFALKTLNSGDINIVTKTGSWLQGSGYDPGDLGEDIRTLPLTPEMSKTTIYTSHPNLGNCLYQ